MLKCRIRFVQDAAVYNKVWTGCCSVESEKIQVYITKTNKTTKKKT
jgi:hypothetical protein